MAPKNKPYSKKQGLRAVKFKIVGKGKASFRQQQKRKIIEGNIDAKLTAGRFGLAGSYNGARQTNVPQEGVETMGTWQQRGLDLTVPVLGTSADLSLGGTQTRYGSQVYVKRPEFTGTIKQKGKPQYEYRGGLSWPVGSSGRLSFTGKKDPKGLTGMLGYKTSFNKGGKVKKGKRKK